MYLIVKVDEEKIDLIDFLYLSLQKFLYKTVVMPLITGKKLLLGVTYLNVETMLMMFVCPNAPK